MAHIPPSADDNSDSSELDLSIQEVIINDSDPITLFPAGPNTATPSSPKLAAPSHFFLIPKTDYAPAYSSPFLINLSENYPLKESVKLEQLFEHLNCFQLTPFYDRVGPTLNSLKQHTAAICCLIFRLHQEKYEKPSLLLWPRTAPKFLGAFDFLNDVDKGYFPKEGRLGDKQHSEPLTNLLNSIASGYPGLGVLSHNQAQLLREADNILTRLDQIYRDTGGIQSIPLPPPQSPMRESLLARWIEYVQRLKRCLILLQSESIALRQVLSHEAVIPNVRAKPKLGSESDKEKVIPQESYIFAGLSGELHAALRQQLNMTKAEAEHRAHDLPKQGSRGIFARGWGDFYLDDNASGKHNEDRQRNVKAWIETSSRLYKIRGHDTIFVIPGFGIHPDAQAIDEHYLQAHEQLFPVPEAKRKNIEAERNEAVNRLRALINNVETLRRQLRDQKKITASQKKIAVLEAKLEMTKGNRGGRIRKETED